MRFILLIVVSFALNACASREKQQIVLQMQQGESCWEDTKNRFYMVQKDSPAEWFLHDEVLFNFQDKTRVTNLESKDLKQLLNDFNICYSHAFNLTGNSKYDGFMYIGQIANKNIQDNLHRYINGEINRGQYSKEYSLVKNNMNASFKQQEDAFNQKVRDEWKRRVAKGFAAMGDNIKEQQRRNEELNNTPLSASSDYSNQYNMQIGNGNSQREIADMEQNNRQELERQKKEFAQEQRKLQQIQYDLENERLKNIRLERGF